MTHSGPQVSQPRGRRRPRQVRTLRLTEPNITDPLCWLDFEHTGRNTLAGDAANFLWYLLGMGGWLVPAYQPEVYARTLRTPVPPAAVPVIDRLRVTARHVEIDYTWQVGAGRHRPRRAAAPPRRRPRDGPGPGQ